MRKTINVGLIDEACSDTISKLFERLRQKGFGVFASHHEILGIIQQETQEYNDAIHLRKSEEEKIEELKDIAVACIFGIASVKGKSLDW